MSNPSHPSSSPSVAIPDADCAACGHACDSHMDGLDDCLECHCSAYMVAPSSSESAPTPRADRALECGKRFGDGCRVMMLSGYGDAHECCGARGHDGNCKCRCAVPNAERAPTATIDCRSPDGETVGLIDAAIVTLRLAARRDRASDAVRAALSDLRADREIAALLASSPVVPEPHVEPMEDRLDELLDAAAEFATANQTAFEVRNATTLQWVDSARNRFGDLKRHFVKSLAAARSSSPVTPEATGVMDWQAIAEENDGHAKRHAAEVNELRAELAELRDKNALARGLENAERWLEQEQRQYTEFRATALLQIEALQQRARRAESECAKLDRELFNASVAARSTPTGASNG